MKRLICTTVQPSGTTTSQEIKGLTADSRLGQFFYPSGAEGEFGQVRRLDIFYTDGHVRMYRVIEGAEGE